MDQIKLLSRQLDLQNLWITRDSCDLAFLVTVTSALDPYHLLAAKIARPDQTHLHGQRISSIVNVHLTLGAKNRDRKQAYTYTLLTVMCKAWKQSVVKVLGQAAAAIRVLEVHQATMHARFFGFARKSLFEPLCSCKRDL